MLLSIGQLFRKHILILIIKYLLGSVLKSNIQHFCSNQNIRDDELKQAMVQDQVYIKDIIIKWR